MMRAMMGKRTPKIIAVAAPPNGDTGSFDIYTFPVGEMKPGTVVTVEITTYRSIGKASIYFTSISGKVTDIGTVDLSGRDTIALTFAPTESGTIEYVCV